VTTVPKIEIRQSETGFKCYGVNADFYYSRHHEQCLAGPFETGKTITMLHKAHVLLSKYPHCRALLVRKTYTSLLNSAIVTYETKVLPTHPDDAESVIRKFGGERVEWYGYPNGSRLIVSGLDNADKTLSAEYDYIIIPQVEELALDEYETLVGRATGRAGNAPYPLVMSDCNPSYPTHWLKLRPEIKMFNSRHEDNPVLYNQNYVPKPLTEQGERTMKTLDALTGIRYKRGRLGLWVGVEGAVYEEFDVDTHVIEPFDIPTSWARYRSIDFGYRNPFVCQWWAEDNDGRLYLYREIYMSQRTINEHARLINQLSQGEHYAATVADHDASDRATLEECGIYTDAAIKDVKQGIEQVQLRLRVQDDGRPRIFFFKNALVERDGEMVDRRKPTCTVEEFPHYAYPAKVRKGKNVDENPMKTDDHGLDAMRYMIMYFDEPMSDAGYITIPNLYI
jgi:phage terminase large subunit